MRVDVTLEDSDFAEQVVAAVRLVAPGIFVFTDRSDWLPPSAILEYRIADAPDNAVSITAVNVPEARTYDGGWGVVLKGRRTPSAVAAALRSLLPSRLAGVAATAR